MAIQNIGENVRRLMKVRDLSIAKVAVSANLGTATLSNILNGKSSPNSTTLIKIAQTLDVSINDLLVDVPELKSLRFRTNKKLSAREVAQRDQIIIDVTQWLKNYTFIENITEESEIFKFKDITTKNPTEAAHQVRALLNLNQSEPIQDLVSLIEKSGIKVFLHPFNFKRTFGISLSEDDGGPAIIVNTDSSISLERKIFTLAHELGHIILHSNSFNGKVEEENTEEESQANEFASELLVPQKAFEEKLKEYNGFPWYEAVLQIKRYFYVSYKTILYRLTTTKGNRFYNDKTIYVKFAQAYNKKYHHDLKDHYEPDSLDGDPANIELQQLSNLSFVEDRYSSLVRTAYDSHDISMSRAAELLNLSIEEMRERIAEWL